MSWFLTLAVGVALMTLLAQAGCMYRHWRSKRRRGDRTWDVPSDVCAGDVAEAYRDVVYLLRNR